MCLKPVKIRTPFKKIALQGGQPLTMEVPCGSCAECKKRIRLEWHFRTYHQCEECVSNGGFIYYDTLTYSDEHVPHLSDFVDLSSTKVSDFTCFNSTHWRNFLKNLRRQLNYYYRFVNFKYFLTSEYGTDERYTHRPHYHVLFFVDSKRIDPYDFSKLVSSCWSYGRTDGLPYQTRDYVADNIFGYDLGTNLDNKNYLKVCGYVSKYITKDSSFQDNIYKRLSLLRDIVDEDTFKRVSREISMFHRQSKGFGLSYIKNLDDDERDFIFRNNACRIKDKKKVVLVLPLPLYYKRKLFYDCIKLEDGSLSWIPNYDGVKHAQSGFLKAINTFSNRMCNIYSNSSDDDKRLINRLLGDRTFEDYSVYMLFYRGRCRALDSCNLSSLFQSTSLTDDEINLYDWLHNILLSRYVHKFDEDRYLFRDVDSDELLIPSYNGDLFRDLYDAVPYSANLKNITFNEDSCIAFKDFDKLTSLIHSITEDDRINKQKTFDFIEDLTKRFKILYYGK